MRAELVRPATEPVQRAPDLSRDELRETREAGQLELTRVVHHQVQTLDEDAATRRDRQLLDEKITGAKQSAVQDSLRAEGGERNRVWKSDRGLGCKQLRQALHRHRLLRVALQVEPGFRCRRLPCKAVKLVRLQAISRRRKRRLQRVSGHGSRVLISLAVMTGGVCIRVVTSPSSTAKAVNQSR